MSFPPKLEKEVRRLKGKKYRKELFKYVLEGNLCIRELFNTKINPYYLVYTTKYKNSNNPKNKEIFSIIKQRKISSFEISEELFRKLVDTISPQGILAVVPMKFKPIEEAFKTKKSRIFILDRLSDPGNLGTIIRSAVAFGVSGIIVFSNSVEVFNPKVMRSCLGSHFHIPIIYDVESEFIIDTLKSKNYKIYATSPHKGKTYREIDKNDDKIAIIIGNEHHGIDNVIALLEKRQGKNGQKEHPEGDVAQIEYTVGPSIDLVWNLGEKICDPLDADSCIYGSQQQTKYVEHSYTPSHEEDHEYD